MPVSNEEVFSIKSKQYVLIAQDRFSVESFLKQDNGDWLLSATNLIQQSHPLESIQCALSLADVYDKVEFAAPVEVE